MTVYDLNLIETYNKAQRRVEIYNQVIKDHKELLKKYDKNSKESKEIRELIDFVKGLDDYKKVNKETLLCMLGMMQFN